LKPEDEEDTEAGLAAEVAKIAGEWPAKPVEPQRHEATENDQGASTEENENDFDTAAGRSGAQIGCK
jgi:hypothetical protein